MSNGNENHRRDRTDRRGVSAIRPIAANGLCVALLLLLNGPALWAQSAFAPPPPPSSSVRGLYDPARSSPSPARIAPKPAQAAPAPVSSITPTLSANAQPLEGGEIVARVDGQIVLASDVLWQVNQIVAANRDRIPPQQMDAARRSILRQQVMGLIDTKLLYADFRRKVPAENLPTIEENLAKPFEENEIPRLVKVLEAKDRHELESLLENHGASLADLQRQFTERTIAGEWLRQMAPKTKPVTHEQMLEYYQEHLADYEFPSQAKWEELMLRFDRVGNDRTATWRAIAEIGNELWQRVAANPEVRGAVFTKIAQEKSHGLTAKEGGLHDWTTRGSLRSKAIDEALFSLEVGQLSNIVESEIGFHIVRVLERKDAGRTSFEEAQSKIRTELERGLKQKLVEAELVKLRKKSRVWTAFDGDLSGPQLAKLLGKRSQR